MSGADHQLDALMRKAIDGELPDHEADRLAALLRDDDAALRRYLTVMETDALLEEELTPQEPIALHVADESFEDTSDAIPEPLSVPCPSGAKREWAMAAAVLIGAAIIAIVSVSLSGPGPVEPTRPVVGVVLEQRRAIWDAGNPVRSGEDVTNEYRALASGRVEFQTRSGVNVRIAGPARFAPISANVTRLDAGRMVARVPKGAEGYTIRAPGGLEIVDLGTAFAIDAMDDGRTLVYVYEGKVELRIGERVVAMTAGDAKVFDSNTGVIAARQAPDEHFADLHPYRLDLVNDDFETGDLTGWTAHTIHPNATTESVIVPLGGKHKLDIPPDGVFEPRVLRLGFKYLPISLRQTTQHAVVADASYTIAVRARAYDIDGAAFFSQPFDIIAHVDGKNVVTETAVADGQWRWYLARIDASTLKQSVGKPLEIRVYKPGNKEGDFIWIDAVQLWRGELNDPSQIEEMIQDPEPLERRSP